MTNRELIEAASSKLATYKSPNIDEALEFLNSIIVAAGLGSIVHEHVDSIDIHHGNVHVKTSWSARCCSQESEYLFPETLLDAEDPEREARIFGLNQRLAEEESELARYKGYVAAKETTIMNIRYQLERQ